ncbi:hypothetical protein AB0N29_16400 [Nocardioides sp. NPDC092400]|uniref:hypothetical protein n=1 Tax=Nocardioides sp. NPDC092400 TaxID=3155196 RepID=UPI003423F7F5
MTSTRTTSTSRTAGTAGTDGGPGRYRRLPAPVRLEDTVTSQQTAVPPDSPPEKDPERDFMLRYVG